MVFVWLGLIILAVILESVTTELISIWFVVGGLGGLVAGAFDAPPVVQVLVAAAVTLLSLFCTRPLVMKKLKRKPVETNAGRYIDQVGVVTEGIDNLKNIGQVKVMGSVWTARTEQGELLPVDSRVRVLRIEGVKMIVRPLQAGQETN